MASVPADDDFPALQDTLTDRNHHHHRDEEDGSSSKTSGSISGTSHWSIQPAIATEIVAAAEDKGNGDTGRAGKSVEAVADGGISSEDANNSSSSLTDDDDGDDGQSSTSSPSPSLPLESRLPSTVTVLPVAGAEGGTVYLVGTAHFSRESNEDVGRTIRLTRPDVVVVELCDSRLAILALDEETILREAGNLSLEQIRGNIRKSGLVQGIMYTLLLSLSAQLTRDLGMAPGGEFRRAFHEAKQIPGCLIQLGDRPVDVTISRAISSLSLWQKVKLGVTMILSQESVTKEDVEKCKQQDLLQSMLRDIVSEYPAMSRVLVDERDIYLTYSLQLAARTRPNHIRDRRQQEQQINQTSGNNSRKGAVVVGVVGIGHKAGIIANWGKVRDEDIPPLLHIPPQSMASFLILKTVKYSAVSLLAYGAYRFLLPRSVKTFASGSAKALIVSASKILHQS